MVEQPHVLDRDHRLVGERGDELHLPRGERPWRPSGHRQDTDAASLPYERHAERRPESGKPLPLEPRIFGVGENVGDVNRCALKCRSRDERAAARRNWMLLKVFLIFEREAVVSGEPIGLSRAQEDLHVLRLAQAARRVGQGIEHGLQVECRAADDFEHIGSGGLLLQRFTKLVEQAGVLDSDDGLGGEVRDERDVFIAKGPHLLPIDDKSPNQSAFFF